MNSPTASLFSFHHQYYYEAITLDGGYLGAWCGNLRYWFWLVSGENRGKRRPESEWAVAEISSGPSTVLTRIVHDQRPQIRSLTQGLLPAGTMRLCAVCYRIFHQAERRAFLSGRDADQRRNEFFPSPLGCGQLYSIMKRGFRDDESGFFGMVHLRHDDARPAVLWL